MAHPTTAVDLQYGSRFGGDVLRLAQRAGSGTGPLLQDDRASTKYGRWFDGGAPAADENPLNLTPQQMSSMLKAIKIAAATKANMTLLGEDAHVQFTARLPVDSKMRKAIRASVVEAMPYFGSCKFGEIILDHDAISYAVLQVFIANYDAMLDTREVGAFYRPKGQDFDQLFFGVNVRVDRNGNPLGFDRDRGADGIAFKTKNPNTALRNIATLASGFSPDQLDARRLPRATVS